jgi:hypothetical protein
MSNVGPVCHIPPTNTPGNPQPQNLPGIPGPVSGQGASQQAINNEFAALLNALRALLLQLANQQGTKGQINNATSKNQKGRWSESGRVVETVRVFQNNDPTSSNWVDVEQINQLKMKDSVTGSEWTWKR